MYTSDLCIQLALFIHGQVKWKAAIGSGPLFSPVLLLLFLLLRSSMVLFPLQIISHMVMSAISAIAATIQFSLGVFTATYDMFSFSPPTTGCYYTIGQYQQGDDIGVSSLMRQTSAQTERTTSGFLRLSHVALG